MRKVAWGFAGWDGSPSALGAVGDDSCLGEPDTGDWEDASCEGLGGSSDMAGWDGMAWRQAHNHGIE